MKKIIIITLIFLTQLSLATTAQAVCSVKSSNDGTSNSNMLRYIFSNFIHNKSDPACDGDSGDTYEKIEFDNDYKIILGSDYTFTLKKDLTLNKKSSVSDYPIVNGFGLPTGDNPFNITYINGAQLTLENIIILTNGVPYTTVVDGRNVLDGGHVYVCDNEQNYDDSLAPGTSGWCDAATNNNWDIPVWDIPTIGDIKLQTFHTYWRDADGDGYGNPAISITVDDPTPPAGYVENSLDCNDNNADYNTGINDCTGDVIYPDEDGDGYGDDDNPGLPDTNAPDTYIPDNTDCNDANGNIHPNTTEICDEIDNDCDGAIDEGLNCNIVPDGSTTDGSTTGGSPDTDDNLPNPDGSSELGGGHELIGSGLTQGCQLSQTTIPSNTAFNLLFGALSLLLIARLTFVISFPRC